MLLRTLHPGKLSAYVTLSLADLFLTYTLVQNSHGTFYESNPIANAWLTTYGWGGLAAFKITAMLLVSGVAAYVSLYRPQTAGRLLGFACCAVALVVVYSCMLANVFGLRNLHAQAEDRKFEQALADMARKRDQVSDVRLGQHLQFRQEPRNAIASTPMSEAPSKGGGSSIKAIPVSLEVRSPMKVLSHP
jgi:hypothetical protein